VVGFAPGGGDGAVGEGTALVAGGEGGALGWGEEPGFAAEVQEFAVGAQECGDDVGVAGDFAQGGGGDGAGEGEVPRAGAVACRYVCPGVCAVPVAVACPEKEPEVAAAE
jgi:hypothetical protein